MKTTPITWKSALPFLLVLGLVAGALASVQSAGAINYTNTLTFSQSGISSTNGSPFIYVPGNPYAVGDLVYFNGTTTANNPFTSAGRYYVIYSSGNNIKVATTYNGAAVNAANSITAAATAQKHPSWFMGSLWLGGVAPNDNASIAGFTVAGGGSTPPGGIVVNSNATVYGLGYVNSSGDLLVMSGSSNNVSLYPLTFATSDGSVPKITMTNASAGVIFLGHNSQAGALKINGTQGLILNSGPGGAVTGSGTAATSTGPGKDIRVFNTVDWSGLSGGIQIERGQVSQQNGTSTLGFNQTLTVGNAQTIANNLIAGFELNGRDCTLDALNGNSLGRVYNSSGNSILKVGNNNGSGDFAGVIGKKFDGSIGGGNVLFNKSGSGTQVISGLIAASAGSTVTVDGGTLILLGTNSYGGATTVNAGKLQVSSGQLTTGTITVASGATLDINVSGTSQLQPSALTLNSTANTLEFLNLASTSTAPLKPGTLNLNGTVTVNIIGGSLVPGNSYPLVNWTTIAGSGGFVLGSCAYAASLSTNVNTLVLTITAGTNTWTGVTDGNWDTATANWTPSNYADGNLAAFDDTASGTTSITVNQVVKPGSASFSNGLVGYSVTSSGANYIGGAGSLVKTGNGTLTLDGPNAYSGGTTLAAGQLNLNYGGSNSTNSAIGSGTLTISGGLLDNTSAGDVTLVPAIAQSWNGDFGYVGSLHSLNLGGGAVTLSANRVVAVTNNTLTVGGIIGDGGGNYSLTKTGNGTLALSGANTFGGGLVLNAGTVKAGNATALGTGTAQLNGGVLDLNGVSLANVNSVNNSAFMLTNSSASAGALAANSTINANFTIGVGSGDITVARLIAGATRTVTKEGAGTLTFNGAGHNNQMAVVVNGGTLICGNNGGYSADRGFTLNSGTAKLAGTGSGGSYPNANLFNDGQAFTVNGGTFDLNGWNETVAIVNGTAGVILNNAASSTLTVGADNNSGSFAGAFQNGTGTLGLAKTGTGTQTLTGTSTYSGATTVSAGTLQAGAANAFSPNSDVTVTGALDVNAFDNAIGALSGAGTVDTVAGGTPTLTIGANGGSGNFTGSIQNSAGTLSLVKTGAGTQALNCYNASYGGTTVVSNGTLVVGTSLGGAGTVTVYGPGVLNATNTSPSIAGAVVLSGTNATLSLLDGGIGTLNLNNGLSLNNSNVLKFDVSSAGLDSIYVSGGFAQSGKAVININQASAPSAGTYPLISGASGISAANFVLGNTLPGYTLSLSSDATTLYLNVSLAVPATAWWHNRSGTAWNTTANWDTDQSGNVAVSALPAAASDIFFAADSASSYSTTLGADFSIKSLTFNTANNVTIAGGNALTLGGPITVNYGAGANNTISAASLVLGVDENVNVADAAQTLNISSPISGAHVLKINDSYGSGTVALAGSSTYTGNTTITYGTLALKNPTNTLPDSSAVTINNGAVLSIGTNTDTVGAITLVSGTITGSSGVLTGSAYNMQNGTVAANLGGTAAMTVNGSLILASNSTYSGGTTISSGSVQVGASNALGSGSVTINNSTALDLNGQTIGNVINFSSAGTLRNDAAADAAVTANANVYNNPTIDTTGGNITVARLIGNAVRTVLKTGDKTLTLNGAGHNNLIKLQVQGGTVICANNGGYSADRGFELDYGTVKLAGPGSGGAYPNANLFNDGESFQILSTPSTFDLNGWNETVGTVYGVSGAVIENSAAGTNSTLTVGADNLTSVNAFSGTLQNGAGVLSIAKTGSGIQIFNGTSTYTGNTTINNGQLQVTATGASPNSTFVVNTNDGLAFATDAAFVLGGLSGTGNVSLLNDSFSPIALTVGGNNASTTYSGALLDGGAGATVTKVGSGTLTLSGTNNYSGLTTVSNGAVILSPNYSAGHDFTVKGGAAFGPGGNPGANSALVGTVTAESGSTLLFSSLPTPATAPITVNTLTLSSTVNISVTAVLTVGTYNLVNYTNLTGGGFGALALGTLPAGVTAHLVNNTAATPKVIQLVVDAVAPQIWSGAVSTNWDVAATANWKIAGSPTNYHDFSATRFDDTVGSGFTLVNLATNVQPSSLTVSNITKNYTFTTANGSGIAGSTALVKEGSGTLTIENVTNTFAGGATISAGTLVLSSATLGSGAITANASLVFSNGTQLVTNVISGSGTVAKNGSGTLELSGANTFNGLAIKNGTVLPDNTGALGTGTITLGDGFSASSATLWLPNQAGNHTYTNPITIAAGGTGTYNLQYVGFPDCHLSGGIALNNAATFTVTAGGALFIDSPIVSGAGSPTITVDGGGTTTKFIYLTADNSATLTSSFIVTNKGNLKSGHTNSLSAANAVALDSTSWLDTGAKSLTIAGLNDFGGVGGTVANSGGGTFLTLGGSGSYAFSGSIQNVGGVVKAGAGTQTLSGANTYTGPTIVSNGTLVISGAIDGGAVTVAGGTLAGTGLLKGATTVSGGTLSPGIGGIGALTISNSLNLQGTLAVDVSNASGTNDLITGLTSVTYGGTLAVNNLGGTLTTSDSFKLFSAGSYNGVFANITPAVPAAGLAWNTNTLTTDGVLRIAVAGPSGPGIITNSIVGGSLNLTWPSGQGWRLESQTNGISTGLSATGWGTVPGAADGSYSATIDPAKPTVFYRLVSP